MNYFFITGTSRGIGKALTEILLSEKSNVVYGISRTDSIHDPNYQHFQIDLNDLDSVKNFKFPEIENAQSFVLVNNSAYEDEVTHLGKKNNNDIIASTNVNYVAPAILMNNFIRTYQSDNCKRIILNISTGAAHRPIESWGTYCASKAALYMLSEVIDIEQKLKNNDNPIRIFSVGPGVVDTKMQTKLRQVSHENFSQVNTFIEYFEKGQLAKPADVAKKLLQIINSPEKFEKVTFSVKDF
ncbi:MAG: SDR family NAD(P)-dependent oxidoreductase [Bacteroidota bacterium]|nr:SDR family NAD(P)-dependent oxidoreductase [Bacteroidota bacterium]